MTIISEDYRVRINGREIATYRSEVASFALHSACGELQVEVEPLFDFEDVRIRPLSAGVEFAVENGRIGFTVDAPRKLSIELDNKILRPLFLLINPPETGRPDPDAPGVHYFAAGEVHEVGLLELKSDETVYIEEGAVVRGAFTAHRAGNLSIRGRGLVDGSGWRGKEKKEWRRLFTPLECNNVTVEGITWLDGPRWHVVPVACEDVRIENINIISVKVCGDGVDIVGSKNVLVKNCFFRTNDDCVAVKAKDIRGDHAPGCKKVQGVEVTGCVMWNARAGNAMEIGYETRADEIRDIVFSDCDIIRCEFEGYQSGATFSIHNGDRAVVSNVLFRDIRVEDSQEKLIDLKILHSKYSRDKERGQIENIRFENIRVVDGPFPVSVIMGYDAEHQIRDIVIEDLYVHGRKMLDARQAKMVVELSRDVVFK